MATNTPRDPPALRPAIDTRSIVDKVDVQGKTLSGFCIPLRALWRSVAESRKVGREGHSAGEECVAEGEAFGLVFGPCPLTNYERR